MLGSLPMWRKGGVYPQQQNRRSTRRHQKKAENPYVAICPPTLECLPARNTIAMAFQRAMAASRRSIEVSPGYGCSPDSAIVLTRAS